MNEKIIAELNETIIKLIEGFNEYGIGSFISDINKLEKIIIFVGSKDYQFLSLNEAIACSRRTE